MIGADVSKARRKDHREDFVFSNGLMEGWNQVLLRDRTRVEEFLHEFILAFGDDLHQSFMSFLAGSLHICRYGAFFALTAAAHFIGIGLHGYQVHDTLEILLRTDRELNGDHLPPESVLQTFERHLVIGSLTVHAAHRDDPGQFDLFGVLPDLFGYN